MKKICRSLIAAFVLVCLVLLGKTSADEGMWLFNNPPRKLLKEKYGFDRPTPGSSTCRSRPCASTAAARARSSRPTAW